MIAAFVLYLSTTTSTTIKVGMKDISTGLVEVFGMIRTNLLVERLIFERKSGGATINYQRDNEVVYGSCKDESHPIMSIHNCVRFCLDECEQACSFRFLVRDSLSGLRLSNVPTAHSNMGGMATLSTVPAVDTAARSYVYVL